VLFSSCVKCDETRVEGAYLEVLFVDSATGKNLYTPTNSLLSRDSLRIVDDNGKNIIFDFVESNPSDERYFVVGIYFLLGETEKVAKSFSNEQCKSVNVYLSNLKRVRYTMCFTSKTVKCGSAFDRLIVNKNGREIPISKGLESAKFTDRL
jgi:hypothetical protein